VAFVAASKQLHGLTADRAEFLGRMGSLNCPAALERIGLASAVQPGLDPCAAVQLHIDLGPGEAQEIFFLLGEAASKAEALQLVKQYQDAEQVKAAWESARGSWEDVLGSVQVQTPDPAMNVLLNRWLLYQTLACRVWGRSAFYQASGAFGFRDQLQDVMALVHVAPHLAHEHILESARQQFEAGDVLHWWHPPSGRGVRTRCSDDLLWLPFVTAHYIEATGDESILDEQSPFRKAAPLGMGEDERYGRIRNRRNLYAL
jgi:cyclic beta-1,2-glucan synthetase